MFMSVRKYDGIKNQASMIEKGEGGLLPLMEQCDGFQVYLYLSIDDHTGVSISAFKTERQSEDAYATCRDWVNTNLREHVSTPPIIINGKVLDPALMPKTILEGAGAVLISGHAVTSPEELAPIMQKTVIPNMTPQATGQISCRAADDHSHMLGIGFFKSEGDGKLAARSLAAAIQQHAKQHFSDQPSFAQSIVRVTSLKG